MRRRIRFQRQKGKAVLLLRGLPGQNAGMAQAGYAETPGARKVFAAEAPRIGACVYVIGLIILTAGAAKTIQI